VRSALIDKDELGRIESIGLLSPRGAGGFIALTGNQGLFLSGQPRRAKARDIVASLRRTPCVASHRAQCSVSVASG
jgi:hypothetical protein